MKKKIFLFVSVFACLVPSGLWAQSSKVWQARQTCVKVQFYTPEIVRVTKTIKDQPVGGQSLVVTLKPQDVSVTKKTNSVSSAKITVKYNPQTDALSFYDAKGKLLLAEGAWTAEFPRHAVNLNTFRLTQKFLLKKDEAIYGLGTIQDGKLNRRDAHILMEQSNLQDFQNVVQSINGWGLFWDNYSPTQFDGTAEGMTFSSDVARYEDYYFMLGGSADGVIKQMRKLSGEVPMFPLWTFGYWQSKERYKSSKELLSVVDKYRELQVPLDGIIQDWQYWGSNYLWNAMDFLSEDFADGKQMVQKVHQKNAHIMISIWASFGPMTKAFRELKEKDLLFDFQTWPQSGISHIWPPVMDYPSGVCVYDPFSEEARKIYWKNLKTLFDYDIDAWWMDSTDPDCFYPTAENYDHKAGDVPGGTFRSLRNAFPLCTVGGVYDAQRKESSKKRVFIMTRSAFAGQQRYGSNMWSGDVNSTWDMLRKQVPAGLNFSLTGNPNFNTDIGGFFCNAYNVMGPGSAPKNPQYQELYVRWMQYGLFCPVFRSHGADAPREIWQFGEKGTPVYDAIEKCIRLRYRLLPYLYSTAWQVTSNNGSYLRPLFSDFAADRNVWEMADEFLLGDIILAAPVVEAQYTEEKIIKTDEMSGWDRNNADNKQVANVDFTQTKQTVKYLPKGSDWYDFYTGKLYKGGQKVTLTTTFDKSPMFIKAGGILPLAPEMQYVTEKDWSSLEIRLYPGKDGSFTLYEDEGDNYNYENGKYSEILFTWKNSAKALIISDVKGSFDGMLKNRSFKVVLPDGKSKVVEYDGKKVEVKM
jgi:alpha-D-xyloside xylohydrolase